MLQKEQSFEPNEQTEEVTHVSFRFVAYNFLRKFLIGFILISIANLIFTQLFYTPKLYNINRENQELIEKYKILDGRLKAATHKLAEIQHRDNHLYRSIFGVDPTIDEVSDLVYPDSKYADLQGNLYSGLMTSSWLKMDYFARSLYAQSVSLDELQILSQNKSDLEAAIPAIWPIDRTKLRGRIGAYGMRRHPIYNRYILHKGIDLAGKVGDPIYATGDAVVEHTERGMIRRGYGQQVLLNHEFGYKTRYAHLSKRFVNKGDTVRRGDIIGEMGSTGGSTGPHLHYEVIHKGHAVNPISYFDPNMTNEEYLRLMEQSQETKFETFDDYGEE
ncbi:MAG: M23 family metallopeptidase [Rikenellaceae bacterium]